MVSASASPSSTCLRQAGAHRRLGQRPREEAPRRRQPAVGRRIEEPGQLEPRHQRRDRRLGLEPQQVADRRVGWQRAITGVVVLQRRQVGTIVRHGRRIANERSRSQPLSVNISSLSALGSMQLFAPSLAFVDLETTGMRAAVDRITEVGIVRVDADPDGGPPRVSEWSSLVDPGEPIPAVIQALTGITDAMVRNAPRLSRPLPPPSRRASTAASSSRTTRASTTASSSTNSRASAGRSRRVRCAR